MKEELKKFFDNKNFHICMVCFMIFIILFVSGITILKYNIEGEKDLPFNISKISIISSVEGIDMKNNDSKWNLDISQNNDIYLYVSKNSDYKKTDSIKEIEIYNFNTEVNPGVGQLKLYKPDNTLESSIFKNSEQNEIEKIKYMGETSSNIKDLKISNQGGLIVFRCSNINIGRYVSNDDEEINHSELLKKLNIEIDNLKFGVSFDVCMKLNSGKNYKAHINLDLPVGDVVNNGIQSNEITDYKKMLFKRI